MENIDELKTILREIVRILELQELVAARKSGEQSVDESSRQLTAEEKDKAIVEEYNAIRERIHALR